MEVDREGGGRVNEIVVDLDDAPASVWGTDLESAGVLRAKAGEVVTHRIWWREDEEYVDPPEVVDMVLEVKAPGYLQESEALLRVRTFAEAVVDGSTVLEFTGRWTGTALLALFHPSADPEEGGPVQDPTQLALCAELRWRTAGGVEMATRTFDCVVENRVVLDVTDTTEVP